MPRLTLTKQLRYAHGGHTVRVYPAGEQDLPEDAAKYAVENGFVITEKRARGRPPANKMEAAPENKMEAAPENK